jgi:hypothetical protein
MDVYESPFVGMVVEVKNAGSELSVNICAST